MRHLMRSSLIRAGKEWKMCSKCGGVGWYVDCDPRDPSGETPMQVECGCQSVSSSRSDEGAPF